MCNEYSNMFIVNRNTVLGQFCLSVLCCLSWAIVLGQSCIISLKSFRVTAITPWRGIRVPTGHISSYELTMEKHYTFIAGPKALPYVNSSILSWALVI